MTMDEDDWFGFYRNNTETAIDFVLNSSTINETTRGQSLRPDLKWGDIGLIMLYCCIIAATVIGNTLVIAAVVTTRRLRTVTNCFVMSLAMADWLVGMFVMPVKVLFHISHNRWTLGWLICKIWIALDVMLCTSSILSLCTISIDRYLAITRPLAYSRKRRSKRLALGMISCVWVGSVAITTPPMFKWLHSEQQKPDQCEYEDDPFYVVYSALGSFFVPLLVMLYVYARIACVIATRQSTIQKAHNSKDKESRDDMGLTLNRISPDSRPDDPVTHVNSRRLVGDLDGQGTTRSLYHEIPSRSTLLSMGLSLPPDQTHCVRGQLHSTSHHSKRVEVIKTENGTSGFRITSKTGSRLCHHNATNSSPPSSIIMRPSAQPSSSSSSAGRLQGLTNADSENRLPARVWTVDDDHVDHQRLVRSSIALNNGDYRNCLETKDDLHRSSTAQFPKHSLRRNPGKIQSQSCTTLGTTTRWSCPTPVVRSKTSISQQLSDTPARPFTSGRVASFKRETKTAQTLAAVVGGFIICWLPFFVTYVSGPFLIPEKKIEASIMEFFVWLGWSNSAINPAIYAFYNPDFRSAFWRLTIHKCNGILKVNRRKRERSGAGSGRRYELKENHRPLD